MASAAGDDLIYEFGPFRLDPAERLLLRDGVVVALTPKAFDLLVYLVERHGRLAEKHALMAALWPDAIVEEANLASNVSALRKVLDEGEEAASVIQTVPTRGYRFVAPVKTSRRMPADPDGDGKAVRPELLDGERPAPQLALRRIQAEGARIDAAGPVTVSRKRRVWVLWAVAAACALLAATTLRLSSRPAVTQPRPVRAELVLPPEMQLADYDGGAISPDGRRFVFHATVDGLRRLVLRDLTSGTLVVLVGTDGGYNPFWSPDSQSVAFFDTESHLKQIAVTGRPVRVLANTTYVPGSLATWGAGVILFVQEGRIYRVAATGGTPTALDTLPWKPGQRRYESPKFLPDGRHFLVTVVDDPALYVASLDAPGTRKLLEDGASAGYAAGHLFYSRGAGLFARPFDPERLEFSGAEVQVTERAGGASVSDQGTIVYRDEGVSISRLTWFDRVGRRTGTLGEPGPYDQLVLSPRGRHATVVRGDEQANTWDIWDADLASGIFSRLTTDPTNDADPSWSPDERSLAFISWRTGRKALFVKDLTSGKEDPLVPFDEPVALDQWTPDGQFIIFRTMGKAVFAMPLIGDRTPRMLADTPFIEDEVHVSPDGRWVAFHANESGRWEVYIAAFPAFASKRQISSGGGVQPQWRADGRELFYLGFDGSMMSVRVDGRTELSVSSPSLLFTTRIAADPNTPKYGVTADGQRFLGLERSPRSGSFTVLFNWLNRPVAGAP